MSFIQKAASLIIGDPNELTNIPRKRLTNHMTERDLIRLESEIGAQIFGPLPHGHRREFFCLDSRTWIWYEEWTDIMHRTQSSTIRYEVTDNGVLKVQDSARYSYLEGEEYDHFAVAVQIYYEHVAREIYRRNPSNGQRLQAQMV